MKDVLVEIHNYWRWAVLLLGLASIVLAILAAVGRYKWDTVTDRVTLFFTIALDIQVLLGIIIWVLGARWGEIYLGYIHPIAMLVAVAVAHIGRARAERANTSEERGRTAAIFFVASLVIIAIAIPFGAWPI